MFHLTDFRIFVFAQEEIDKAVKGLLALKAEYKQQTGMDYKPAASKGSNDKAQKSKKVTS